MCRCKHSLALSVVVVIVADVAYYDLTNMLLYVAFAAPHTSGGPVCCISCFGLVVESISRWNVLNVLLHCAQLEAYARQFTMLNCTALFAE